MTKVAIKSSTRSGVASKRRTCKQFWVLLCGREGDPRGSDCNPWSPLPVQASKRRRNHSYADRGCRQRNGGFLDRNAFADSHTHCYNDSYTDNNFYTHSNGYSDGFCHVHYNEHPNRYTYCYAQLDLTWTGKSGCLDAR